MRKTNRETGRQIERARLNERFSAKRESNSGKSNYKISIIEQLVMTNENSRGTYLITLNLLYNV